MTHIDSDELTNTMRLLTGLTDPLLAPVAALPEGAHVVQLGCGTGQLSLALARRRPDLRVSAIDIDTAALDIGRAHAAKDNLAVEFREMSMAELAFGDGSVDAVLSRMGLLLPGTAPFDVAAREAARILRVGGVLSMATWTDLASSPYTGVGLPVLRRILPEGTVPNLEVLFAESARPGALEEYLAGAGFTGIEATWYHWEAEYPNFGTWWEFDTGFGPLQGLFDALNEQQRSAARQAMADDIRGYRTASGSYRLPATARLITARR